MAATPLTSLPPRGHRLATMPAGATPQIRFDGRDLRKRRFRITLYFATVALHFLWWDFILKRSWFHAFRTPWVPRWRRLAVRYKELALELQGLWVKLGQFLSTRVDVLPIEITQELESLRDEVPPEPAQALVKQIESEFARPIDDIFEWFSPRPIGSASLAQVHRARNLAGEPVVVKVLRPGVRAIIAADITLLRQVAGWLGWIRPLAQRADIGAMVNEFDAVTTNELDLRLEAKNLERFAADFAGDPGMAVPRVYHQSSSASTLTMEDVSFIRIDDIAALERVGIDPKAVARKLYNVFLQQFFVTYRIHADPHPGNLFVRPMPVAGEFAYSSSLDLNFQPGDEIPHAPGRPFTLVVIDFGMVVEIPVRIREALREFAIGLGMRDARRILASYSRIGVLRPGTDSAQLEEMIEEQLDSFWGTFLGQMNKDDLSSPAARAFFEKYAGLMRATPFQFQSELLFMTRAMGILSGVTSALDPAFDPWTETAPFARRLFQEDIATTIRTSVQDLLAGRLPSGVGSVLRLIPRQPPAPPAPKAVLAVPEEVVSLRRSVNRLTALVVLGAMFAAGGFVKSKGVRVSDAFSLVWPGNDLGQWLLDLTGVAGLFTLLRKGGK